MLKVDWTQPPEWALVVLPVAAAVAFESTSLVSLLVDISPSTLD